MIWDSRSTVWGFVCCLPLLLLLSACTAGRPAVGIAALPEECILLRADSAYTGPLHIAVNDPLSFSMGAYMLDTPTAFHIAATGLRGHLVLRDCQGSLHPGAAVSWQRRNEGRTWQFELADGLSDASGALLSAVEISHRMNAASSTRVARVEAVGSRELVVHMIAATPEVPAALLGPDFALPIAHPGQAVVDVVDARGRDGRDLLEQGGDGLLTRDPAVIEYARLQSRWAVLPLAWDATYVLAVPAWIRPLLETRLSQPFLQGLARDVVPGEARPFQQANTWWKSIDQCSLGTGPADVQAGLPAQPYLGYAPGDPVARALAERLAALSGGDMDAVGADIVQQMLPSDGRRWMPRVLTENADIANMQAFLLALPRTSYDPCQSAAFLATQLPGLLDATGRQHYVLYPLVDVRPTMILRRDRASVAIDAYGRLYFLRAQMQ